MNVVLVSLCGRFVAVLVCGRFGLWPRDVRRNCHFHEMSETVWRERFKLPPKIQPFQNNRCKSTVWRCEHCLFNWQKYSHGVHIYYTTHRMIDYTHLHHQRHRKLLLLTIINMQSTFLPVILPNAHRFKQFFFTGRLSDKFVKNMDI